MLAMPRASGSPLAGQINSLPNAATEMVWVRWKWYVPLVVGRFAVRASPEPPMHMPEGLCASDDGTTNGATAAEVSLRMDGQGSNCRLGDLSTWTKKMMVASQHAYWECRIGSGCTCGRVGTGNIVTCIG